MLKFSFVVLWFVVVFIISSTYNQELDSPIMMMSSNGNTFCITGPLWGESTGHRWIPLTKASDTELWCFLWSLAVQNWASKQDTGDLKCHCTHYNVTGMTKQGLHHIISSYMSQWEGMYFCRSKDNDKNQYSTTLQTMQYLERYQKKIRFSGILYMILKDNELWDIHRICWYKMLSNKGLWNLHLVCIWIIFKNH